MKRLLTLLSALALAACGSEPVEMPETASPAIWEIRSSEGALEGWLFGTIHALPDGVEWRTAAITQAIDRADLLVVEVASLDDQETIATLFSQMARSGQQPPLAERISPEWRDEAAELVAQSGYSDDDFRGLESWASALVLAQAAPSIANEKNGVDKALIADFSSRPIREVEGALGQLTIFDRLPEQDQRDLLDLTVAEASAPADQRRRTIAIWLNGDVEAMLQPNGPSLLDDPELREALVEGRNRQWLPKLRAILSGEPTALIAVGAGHMGGPEGLPKLLRRAGYTVTRLP